ncbi:MAG: hypothetical protein Kow0089_21380 [Desulfobulbaceae bacterium]
MRRELGDGVDVRLIAGSGGVFEVRMNGRLIFSKKQSGRFPEDGEIVRLVKENL